MSVSDNLNLINQMAEEEFSESEVVFSDHHDSNNNNKEEEEFEDGGAEEESKDSAVEEKEKALRMSSMPVNIPQAKQQLQRWDSEESEEMEPPHVIVGRRIAGKMAFSVCTGKGRTLKGRDLKRVRNSILRLTGFIEAEA